MFCFRILKHTKSSRTKGNVVIQMPNVNVKMPEINMSNEIQMPEVNVKNEIRLPKPVPTTPLHEGSSVVIH